MNAIILSFLLLLQGSLSGNQQTDDKKMERVWFPAETVGTNVSSYGFTMTLLSWDNQVYNFNLYPGFDNIDNKWQLVAGIYTVTFTPTAGWYGPVNIWFNAQGTSRYNSYNTSPIVFNNLELYSGGGNQVFIGPN